MPKPASFRPSEHIYSLKKNVYAADGKIDLTCYSMVQSLSLFLAPLLHFEIYQIYPEFG